jgi:uncharacterized protein YeaO (DUF488 family)
VVVGPVRVTRVYTQPSPDGSVRVLVDRLWPRGLPKARACWDEWCKDVAPSAGLRKWYGHDPLRFEEFARRYCAELETSPAAEALDRLERLVDHGPVTLLTASRDVHHSQAAVLARLLMARGDGPAAQCEHPGQKG